MSTSNWPTCLLGIIRGSKRVEDNRGFIKMLSSMPEERAVRTGVRSRGNIIWPKQVLTGKKIRVNHLWSPWKLPCNPSSHLLMKPQSPFINLLKNLFFLKIHKPRITHTLTHLCYANSACCYE